MSFRIFSTKEIDAALKSIVSRWDAEPETLESFRGWAWVVASVAETCANENVGACSELLRDEKQALHRIIAERFQHVNSISLELVSKRSFLEFLERELDAETHMSHAA